MGVRGDMGEGGTGGNEGEGKARRERERRRLTCEERDLFRQAAGPRPRRARPCWGSLPVCV